MNPTPDINTSTKSEDLKQNTSSLFSITHRPHPTTKLPRIQMFKTDFRKLSILSKFWEWRKWRIAYENRYMTHPLNISQISQENNYVWVSF